jgi:DNA-binding GntR family transcriptional regulator
VERRHRQALADLESEGLTDRVRQEMEDLEVLLHNGIIASLNNPLIDRSYKRMHNYLKLVRLDRKLTVPLAQRSLREHMEIILACKARDPEKAVAALSAHFTAALQRHMGMF